MAKVEISEERAGDLEKAAADAGITREYAVGCAIELMKDYVSHAKEGYRLAYAKLNRFGEPNPLVIAAEEFGFEWRLRRED